MNVHGIRQLPGVATALLLVAGLVAGPVQAQQGTVAGQVTDKSNQQPVAGAQVLIVGTSLQARTSREGRYTIAKVPAGQYQVQLRLIGYATATQSVTVAAGETASLDFVLTPAAVPLDVVVVSATGQEQLKRELGNNVGSIDAAKIAQEAAPVNAADLLNSQVPGVEVILTRRTDDFVPLQERTAIANREGADLFLSIHANASPNAQARGIETYFLNFASNLSAAAVAARENAASGQAMGALPDLVKTIALNNKLDESRDLARQVQHAMLERLRSSNKTIRDLGVKQAPFVVLIGAAMPSVLAEISFITNTQEGKLLKGNAYRQRIAEALFNAIRKYQTSLKSATAIAHQ